MIRRGHASEALPVRFPGVTEKFPARTFGGTRHDEQCLNGRRTAPIDSCNAGGWSVAIMRKPWGIFRRRGRVVDFKTVLKHGAKIGVKQGMRKLPFAPALGPIDKAKALIRAPSVARLVWALFQDPRVPIWQKGAALSALGLVVSPIDLIQAIPVVGEISDLVLVLFILDTFVKLAPADVVNEHISRLGLEGEFLFAPNSQDQTTFDVERSIPPEVNVEPLAARMRPRTLDDFVGQEHILGPGRLLRRLIESDQIGSMIFWGPPGAGKTTLATVIAGISQSHFVGMSAVNAGVADLRKAVEGARKLTALTGQRTILFIDEIHRFNKAQQDAILPHVERGTVTLIGATTENPSFEVNSALLSRTRVFTLKPLAPDSMEQILTGPSRTGTRVWATAIFNLTRMPEHTSSRWLTGTRGSP